MLCAPMLSALVAKVAVPLTSDLLPRTVAPSMKVTVPVGVPVPVAGPTSAVTTSGTPSAFSTSVTFTANVGPATGTGTPTGTVTFMDGATVLGSRSLVSGTGTFATNALSIGAHNITGVYSGDTSFAGSTSPILVQTVTGATALTADISVTVTHSANSPAVIPFGGKLAITVTVINNDATNPATVALTLSTVAGPFELDSVVPPGAATCNPPSAGTIQCSIPALAASTNAVFTVNVRPLFSGVRTFTAIAA